MDDPRPLRIRLLGGFEVEGLAASAVGSRKARALVKVLALGAGGPVPADRLAEALWGDTAPDRPVEQLSVLVSRLRSVLGADRFVRTEGGWALRADWVDVSELVARADEAAARLAASSPAAARAAAVAAIALVRGPLLPEDDSPWVDEHRGVVDRVVARCRLLAAEAALAVGDPGDAAAAAEGVLEHDPYDEVALRLLMRAHAGAGRPGSALAAYARARERLADELGVGPTEATEALHGAILLGHVPAAVPVPAAAGHAVVGRASELDRLDGLLGRALGGDAALVVVEGEAGIGKTALVQAWAAAVRLQGVVVLSGRCDELGRDVAFQPVLDGLAAYLRRLGPGEAERVLGDERGALRPLLGTDPTAIRAAGATTVADVETGRALLFAALLAVVERAGGGAPVVVVVEDVHWAGAATLEWLGFAARRGSRLLVVATRRVGEGRPVPAATIVALGPLDAAAAAELVGVERAVSLHARSGGHPLFLVELAAAGDDELPKTVRDSVASRAAALGPAEATMRAAAVLGHEIDVDLLAGVAGLSVGDLLAHIESGVRTRLLDDRGTVLAFRHDLVREALAAGVTAARRAYIHRVAARELVARRRHDPLVVAWHARLGGDLEAAAEALVFAAETAAARYDLAGAESHLDDAVALAPTATVRLARARTRLARGALAAALEDARAALALGEGAAAAELAGWTAYYARDYEAAGRYAEHGLAGAAELSVRASCLALLGRVAQASGRVPEADMLLDEAVRTGTGPSRGLAQVWLGSVRAFQNRPAEGLDLIDRALLGPGGLGHPFAPLHAAFHRTLLLGMLGRPLDALVSADRFEATVRAAGEQGARFGPVAHNVRSFVVRQLGRHEEADELSAEALGESTPSGEVSYSEPRFAALLDRVEVRLQLGDLDGAAEAIEAAAGVEAWAGTMAWHQRFRYRLLRARHGLLAGEAEAAAEAAHAVVAGNAALGTRRYELLGRAVAARADAALGHPIDHAGLDGVLAELERTAALEAWMVTAEVAATTGVQRWWRDAERRAAGLMVAAGPDNSPLAAFVARRFAALGRR
ncbi:MAG: ATP-binding protein [Acidimicrobiia bacterium]